MCHTIIIGAPPKPEPEKPKTVAAESMAKGFAFGSKPKSQPFSAGNLRPGSHRTKPTDGDVRRDAYIKSLLS